MGAWFAEHVGWRFGFYLFGGLGMLTQAGTGQIPSVVLYFAACGLVAGTLLGAFGMRTFSASPAGAASEWRWGGWIGSALWPPCRRALGPGPGTGQENGMVSPKVERGLDVITETN